MNKINLNKINLNKINLNKINLNKINLNTVKKYGLIGFGVIVVLMQGIWIDHTNPPPVQEPLWDSNTTRELSKRACFDCHSNETQWPWYSYVAPVSWVINSHVSDGRKELNFSNWKFKKKKVDEIFEEVEEGHMPPNNYLWFHSDAKLTEAEKKQLIEGFSKTFGVEIPHEKQ